jgi:hypothetical protein
MAPEVEWAKERDMVLRSLSRLEKDVAGLKTAVVALNTTLKVVGACLSFAVLVAGVVVAAI